VQLNNLHFVTFRRSLKTPYAQASGCMASLSLSLTDSITVKLSSCHRSVRKPESTGAVWTLVQDAQYISFVSDGHFWIFNSQTLLVASAVIYRWTSDDINTSNRQGHSTGRHNPSTRTVFSKSGNIPTVCYSRIYKWRPLFVFTSTSAAHISVLSGAHHWPSIVIDLAQHQVATPCGSHWDHTDTLEFVCRCEV
jgi:hypothetical protein